MPGFGNSRLSRAGMRMLGGLQDAISPSGRGGRAINDFLGQTANQSRRMPRPLDPSAIVSTTRRGPGGLFGSTTTTAGRNSTTTMTKKGLFGMGGRSGSISINRGMMD